MSSGGAHGYANRWNQLATGAPGLLALLSLGALQAVLWIRGLPSHTARPSFAWLAIVLFALQLASIAIAWQRRDRGVTWVIVGFALLFRIAAWTWPPVLSDDLYRYIWDGRVQLAGHDPYAAPPASDSLSGLRDDAVWPNINRPGAVTVYPPGGQLAFLAMASLGIATVGGVKATAIALELGALLLVALALRRRQLPIGRLAIYAWCPLVIAEIAGSGHIDALVLPLSVGALVMADGRRATWAGALIGAAGLIKLYPLALVAALPRSSWKTAGPAAAIVFALGYVPYGAMAGAGVLGFLPDYVGVAEDFNLGIRGFVEQAIQFLPHARPIAMVVCAAVLVVVIGRIGLGQDADPIRRGRNIALAFVLLVPTAVHPWYATWLVPLTAIHPSAAAIWIAGVLPLSYLKYTTEVMPWWVPIVEWLPALALWGQAPVRNHWKQRRF